jgi:hypothetical protein
MSEPSTLELTPYGLALGETGKRLPAENDASDGLAANLLWDDSAGSAGSASAALEGTACAGWVAGTLRFDEVALLGGALGGWVGILIFLKQIPRCPVEVVRCFATLPTADR